jgi:hypothetical protein
MLLTQNATTRSRVTDPWQIILEKKPLTCRLFAALFVIGVERFQQGKEESSMPKYMLLLRDDRELFGKLGPEEMQMTIEKYFAWRNKPFVVDGAGLMEKTGRVMQKKNGSVSVTAGPYSESSEVMGGYYTIEAANFDEAVKLSADNPHVNFGTIEIREVAHRSA